MYEVIRNVILSGRFELVDMLSKIDTIWLQGNLTDNQRAELVDLARNHAEPENSYAGLKAQVATLFQNYTEMGTLLASLTDRVTVLEGGTVEPAEPEEYPLYKAPTGAHDAYNTGDKITYNGKRYICVATEGTAVAWSPDVMPDYWQETE